MTKIPDQLKNILPIFIALLFGANACKSKPESNFNFEKQEAALILNGDTSVMLPVLQITDPGHYKILKAVSRDIAYDDTLLPVLLRRMYLSMTDTANPGVGIAAPQVGISRNVIWVQRFDKENEPFEYYLNPRITWHSNLIRNDREGCLSIPDTMGMVDRYYTIQITYQNIRGENITEIIEGFTAVIFQHETDHLNGILFTDRMKEQEHKNYAPLKSELKLSEEDTR